MAATAIVSAKRLTTPPSFAPLQRRSRPVAVLLSLVLHSAALSAALWWPMLAPANIQVYLPPQKSAELETLQYRPLTAPGLPQLSEPGSGSSRGGPAGGHAGGGSGPAQRSSAPPRKPDFAGPQEIVADLPNPVNR